LVTGKCRSSPFGHLKHLVNLIGGLQRLAAASAQIATCSQIGLCANSTAKGLPRESHVAMGRLFTLATANNHRTVAA